ncbi:hypothetical protein [Emticicia sp. 17c]|uniref:hypothetical protein n=1 Tax=Emticicia sp. 17c TaxID=3127704 RepID=UPI00301D1CEA
MQFITNIKDADGLQNLSDELKKVGVSSFRIDFGVRHILTIKDNLVNETTIECAVRKAGFTCTCFKKCNHTS